MPSNEPAQGAGPAAPPPPPLRAAPPLAPLAAEDGPERGQYEFSYADNATIHDLGSKMSFVGFFMLGIGLFFFGTGIVRWVQDRNLEVGMLFLSLLFMVVGIWTHRGGREFLDVARTHGNDISHLMVALANLRRFYTLLYLLFFVALIFAVIQLGAHSLYGTKEQHVGAIRPARAPRRLPIESGKAPEAPAQPQGSTSKGEPSSTR
ncbi:hypothetical protein OJF2_71200 [Aquisphaera giovannonii]|uniref:Uncharacterized protein n=1 Tax=Aquisphaera giovannonii TaxID=406548 RepID=A0A5B9WDC5_9BACT|nr:hypothetical protein [Aquisphaera giovannonii]QEH38517.1 hypothetical protein OJF2_71200 [Aquisphaera giovannonii]